MVIAKVKVTKDIVSNTIKIEIIEDYTLKTLPIVGKEYYLDLIPVEDAEAAGVSYSNGPIMHHPV